MNFISNQWKKIINLGITKTLPIHEQRKIRLLNQFTLGSLIGVILLVIQNIFLSSPFLNPLFTAIFLVSILYANYLKKHLLAQRLYTLIFPIVVSAVIITYGDDIRLEYSYLIFILTAIIFFNTSNVKWLLFIYYGILYGISQYYVYFYKSPLEEDIEDVEKYVIFILISLVVGLVINSYVKFNLNYEKNNKELVNRLQLQNKELNIAYSELEKFSYIASHDLKSPLRNIVSFSGLLKRRLKDKDEISKEYLEFIISATTQMNYLITDVLEFSKINNLKGKELYPIDLNIVMNKALKHLSTVIQDKKAKIHFQFLPTIISDEFLMVTIFQNLIENGLKYNNSSHPEIVISSQINVDKKNILITFKDNGIGVAAEFQEQIFEMFKRLHTYDMYSGSGIGLAQCKKITEQLGGSIWVKSNENKGSTFFVQLPHIP
ncbi:MAG: ATP-binding protein [Saprospiraceae bacterium]